MQVDKYVLNSVSNLVMVIDIFMGCYEFTATPPPSKLLAVRSK